MFTIIQWKYKNKNIYSGFSGQDTLLGLLDDSDSVLLALFDRRTAPGLGYGLIW